MKILVEIDLPNVTAADIVENRKDWFPDPERPEHISIDEHGYLKRDPSDDSFIMFKLVEVRP